MLFETGWNEDPEKRLSFNEIGSMLDDILVWYGIRDTSGRKFWNKHFKGQILVPFDNFFSAFTKSRTIPEWIHPEKATKLIQMLLGQDVALEKFGYFLDWYGPLVDVKGQSIWDRICSVASHPSFYGEISKEKAGQLLLNQPAGSYITRASYATLSGHFALSFVDGTVFHKRFKYDTEEQLFTTSITVSAPDFTSFCQNQKWGTIPFSSASPFQFMQSRLSDPLDDTSYVEDVNFNNWDQNEIHTQNKLEKKVKTKEEGSEEN